MNKRHIRILHDDVNDTVNFTDSLTCYIVRL